MTTRNGADVRVLVVGAGIAGLATARALRQVGIGCDLVERKTDWVAEGLGIYLPANAIRAMRMLGIHTPPGNQSEVIAQQRFLDHRGRLLLQVDLARVWGTDDPCLATSRAALHQALRDGLDQSMQMGTTVAGLRADGAHVDVRFDDGRTRPYDVVIGADGVHSAVRRLMLGTADDEVVRPVGQIAWRFITECPREVTTWSVMLGHRSTFLTIPIGAGRVYCYADVSVQEHEPVGLASQFKAYAEPVGEILAGLDGVNVHRSPIEEVVLQDWVFGCVALVGDAAHATSPNMAQGAAMAMEDALVLARSLTETADVAAGLARFAQQRHPRTAWVRDQTHRRDRTRNLPAIVRNAALKIAGQRIFRGNYAPLVPPP